MDLFSDEIRKRERARRKTEPLWGLLSFLLHGAFFAAVIFLTPVKELIVAPKEEPARNAAEDLSADRIEEIGETLSDVRANELLRQIQDLQAVLHNMDLMKEELAKDYDAFAEKNAESAKDQLLKLVDETEAAQKKSVEAQAVVKAEIGELVRIETKEELRNPETSRDLQTKRDKLMCETVEKTNTAQADAVNALDKLQTKADFAAFRKTAEAAERFREAQIEVARLQDGAQTSAIEIAERMASVSRNANAIAAHEKAIAEAKEKRKRAGEKRADRAKFLADNAAFKAEHEEALAKLREGKKWNEVKELKKRNEPKLREMSEAKREVERADRTIAQAERDIRWREERVKPDYARREQLEKFRQDRATEAQLAELDKSEKAQRELNERLAILKDVLSKDRSQLEKLAQAEKREENALVREEAAAMKMSEAYALARRLETAVSESFKDIKSVETALAKKMSFAAAAKLTDVAKPDRPEVDGRLLEEKVRTKDALDRQKVAQAEVVRLADAMAENAKSMMEKAMEIVCRDSGRRDRSARKDDRSVRWMDEMDFEARADAQAVAERMAEFDAAAEHQLELYEAAAESADAKAKDLANLMKGQDGSVEAKGAKGDMTGASSGPPELKAGDLALVPGNVMAVGEDARGGLPAKWMYVDSWHVIGPFPNPNRANLRRKFAPESKVDLDATYVGKDGRTLRWEYQQAKNSKPPQPWMADWHAEVIPDNGEEYSIFYAYAEVFFDEACDRWIAIGSDDRSDVWINDIPVWGSSNRLKSWTLAEDFRRVHFKKGRNRILARIENGHWNFGWSVCISTMESPR